VLPRLAFQQMQAAEAVIQDRRQGTHTVALLIVPARYGAAEDDSEYEELLPVSPP
jgi:hypothetical protein